MRREHTYVSPLSPEQVRERLERAAAEGRGTSVKLRWVEPARFVLSVTFRKRTEGPCVEVRPDHITVASGGVRYLFQRSEDLHGTVEPLGSGSRVRSSFRMCGLTKAFFTVMALLCLAVCAAAKEWLILTGVLAMLGYHLAGALRNMDTYPSSLWLLSFLEHTLAEPSEEEAAE